MDVILLDYELKKKGITKEELSVFLNIDKATLYRKLTGKSEFKRSEIQIIKERLNLSNDLIDAIFFS